MSKVSLVEDPVMTAEFLTSGRNVNRIPALVTIELVNGSTHRALCTTPAGTPGPNTSDYEQLMFARKHRTLLSTRFELQAINRIIEAIQHLPTAPDLQELTDALMDINES
ncbi:hypothetical protein NUV89_00590 [Pseudomonas sp. 18.1.10]|uniref:hypothetical protein n=1 Tax=Pseudomonas sp. 18.1.10 TaxID=2969302 RepID=UPI00215013C7|nr:hypothetical protein [Pseudomonas sp. 18.1.10]MCR4536892.1 hypothetical protein [Pseudomonas sp. 18.1.10]